jgi:trimethylamine--corrinoid protein Co-methyltransferase
VQYSIKQGLSGGQLDRLYKSALKVLDKTGVRITNSRILGAVSDTRGIRIHENRVRMSPEVVDGFVKEHLEKSGKAPERSHSQDFTIQILNGYAFQNLDIETGEHGPMNTKECIWSARLVDSLHSRGVLGGTPGLPQDVDPVLREVLAFRIGCENSRTAGCVGATSEKTAEYIYRMSEVAGIRFGMSAFALSPLRVEGETIDMVIELVDKGYKMDIAVEAMPMQGVTTPVYMPSAFTENIATVLGTFTVLRLTGLDMDMDLHFDLYPFDMKSGSIAYGTPEHILAYLMGTQINRFFGGSETGCKAFHTNALFPDAHSIMQRASFGSVAALNGARRFDFGGLLGIDKIFSAEQLVVDVEIVDYLKKLVRGIEFSERTLDPDMIDKAGPGGDYLTHESTIQACESIWSSELFQSITPENWENSDKKRVKEKIQNKINGLLNNYDFSLSRDKQREIEDIYHSAEKEMI